MARVAWVLCATVAWIAAGCGDNRAALDGASPDAAVVDAATDAPTDAPTDAATDAPTDAAIDAPADAAIDAPTDAAEPTLDPSFGVDGWLPLEGDVGAVAILPDQKVLLCGSVRDPTSPSLSRGWVRRLLPDGSPDASFTGPGLALTGGCEGIDVLADGRIVVVSRWLGIKVLSPAGVLVPGPAGAGFTSSVVALPDGGFAAAGVTVWTDAAHVMHFRAFVGRYGADLDPALAFGAGGTVSLTELDGIHLVAVPLARVDGARLLVSHQGQIRRLAETTGAVDGSVPSASTLATGSVALAVHGSRMVGAMCESGLLWIEELHPLLPPGARVGGSLCAGYGPADTTPSLTVSPSGRFVLTATRYPQAEVQVARYAGDPLAVDPAWPVGRRFTLPSYCGAGTSCTHPSFTDAVRAAIGPDDRVIVIGTQVDDQQPANRRGFVARLAP